MFKVECPGCKAPYQVDERRIPQSGLKMRCPKCGSSFKVESPNDPARAAPTPVLGAVLGVTSDSLVPPPDPGPKAPSPLKATMLGVAPAAPGAPGAPRPGPPAPPPRAKAASQPENDLPAPVARGPADLPSPVAKKAPPPAPTRGKPPAPVAAPPKVESEPPFEIEDFNSEPPDLPAAVGQKARPAPLADLPSPAARAGKAGGPAPLAPTLDLPAVSAPAARNKQPSFSDELDLPSVSASRPPAAPVRREPEAPGRLTSRSFGEIELDLPDTAHGARPAPAEPSPSSANLPGLVRPAARPSARASAAEFDLPSLHQGFDLPSPAENLPSLGGELPSVSRAGLPSISSSPPGIGLPALPGEARPAPISLPPLDLEAPAQPSSPLRSFGELDLDALGPGGARTPSAPRAAFASRPDDSLEADPFGEADLPPPRSLGGAPAARISSGPPPALGGAPRSNPAVVRQAGGGTAYGEVNLNEGLSDDVSLEAAAPGYRAAVPSDQDMEFGDVPQEPSARPAAPVAVPGVPSAQPSGPVSRRVAAPSAPAPARKRALRWLIVPGVILVGGAALAFVPNVGPFGAYFIIDQLRAGQYQEELSAVAKKARTQLALDTASDARKAAAQIDAARSASPRVRALRTLAAYVAAERELRFGSDPELHAHAKVLLDEFEAQEGLAYLDLARAGRAASEGQLQRARALLQKAPQDADALLLSGEVELKGQDAPAALAVWQKLDAQAPSARSKFGLARARLATGDTRGASEAAKAALAQNPAHVGAKNMLAALAAAEGREAEAIELLQQVSRDVEHASNEERVVSNTQLGDIHLSRSRISKAEAAYTEALKIDPKAARPLIGVGEALFRAGRYSEAQARFEAGGQADAESLAAKVGVAKSKLMLERVEEANALLRKLREGQPNSVLVAYWYGRVLEAVGDRDQAEKVYSGALEKTQNDPALVDTYIALALLQNQQGRTEAAQKTLARAREKLPPSVAIYKALGDVAISQGRFTDAVSDLNKALELDSEDLGARFRLGVAYRRDKKHELAFKAFDQVAAADPDYPGLALERGMLYEATGRSEEALRAYEAARQKAPNDTDLMLRVGCGYATAGRGKEAEELLRKVLTSRPTSAETHYCLGRALFSDSSRLADALRLFERAVELDPHRAEYHLYAGWASRESGNLPKATRSLDQAVSLDQGLADAYWQRGILRQQQGAVKDALADLLRALELRPERQEIHAALADAYFDLGREAQALAEWKLAVQAQPENSTWHFRYGKLLVANHMNDLARVELSKALDLHEKSPAGDRWLPWEAHLLLARAIGPKGEAIPHWNEFLRLGPVDSPYRAEAKAALDRLVEH